MRTDTRATTRKPKVKIRMDQSSPGQFKPTPSPTQKAPKADKRTPTQNFSVFSGIAVSGLWMASPSSTTHNSAAKAPMLAGINKPTPPAPTDDVQRYSRKSGPKRGHDEEKYQQGRTGARQRPSPTTDRSNRKHSRQRLDELDQRGQESRRSRRPGMGPINDHQRSRFKRRSHDQYFRSMSHMWCGARAASIKKGIWRVTSAS